MPAFTAPRRLRETAGTRVSAINTQEMKMNTDATG